VLLELGGLQTLATLARQIGPTNGEFIRYYAVADGSWTKVVEVGVSPTVV
jgi:hypothetical protein